MKRYRGSALPALLTIASALALGGQVAAQPRVAAGADSDAEHGAAMRVFDMRDLGIVHDFPAFPGDYRGGVRVALGDTSGDGTPDIIVAPGPGGGPRVRVFDGRDGRLSGEFFAFHPGFLGGVHVAVGDVNGDGQVDIVVGAGEGGGGEVRVFSGSDHSLIGAFFAYGTGFDGETRVAAGDIDGDGTDDLIVGAGPAGAVPPEVRVFSGATLELVDQFFPFAPGFLGGIYVSAGDVTGDGFADIIVSADAGGAPHVRGFRGVDGEMFLDFLAYSPSFIGGVRVAMGDVNDDGIVDLITAPGPGLGPHVKVFVAPSMVEGPSFFAFDPTFMGGLFVAAPVRSNVLLREGFEAP